MGKILIVGAGEYQVSGIKKANEMGYYTISIDGNPDSPGFKISNESHNIDIKDVSKVIKLARDKNIDGVVSFASEVTLTIAAKVSDELNLNFLDYITVKKATDKSIQRKIFENNDVGSPKYFIIKNKKELYKRSKALKQKIIMKPLDSSGSRGVYKIDQNNNIEICFNKSKQFSSNNNVIIEEFIVGEEYTVEAFANHDGTVTILGVSSKTKKDNSYRVATELQYNKNISVDLLDSIKNETKKAIKALGLKNTITHSEVIVQEKSNKIYIVEVAARSGGFGIFDKIIPYISGVDIVKKTILSSLGKQVKIEKEEVLNRSSILKFITPPPGKIKNLKVNKYDKLKTMNYEIGFYKGKDDEIKSLSSDGERTGYIITYDNIYENAKKLAEDIYNNIEIELY